MTDTGRLFLGRRELTRALQRPSAWMLIAVNVGLVAAVFAWDWQVFDVVFLYWVENLVIGAINVVKMATVNPSKVSTHAGNRPVRRSGHVQKFFLIPFFTVHYGLFCYGHGVFVLAMFGDETQGMTDIGQWLNGNMKLAICVLALSHLFSFFANFIGAGEYRNTGLETLMKRPYGRIVVLHITIIIGAFLTTALGSPVGLLVVLVVLKTLVDLAMHEIERHKLLAL